jgi:hypothetical protein
MIMLNRIIIHNNNKDIIITLLNNKLKEETPSNIWIKKNLFILFSNSWKKAKVEKRKKTSSVFKIICIKNRTKNMINNNITKNKNIKTKDKRKDKNRKRIIMIFTLKYN